MRIIATSWQRQYANHTAVILFILFLPVPPVLRLRSLLLAQRLHARRSHRTLVCRAGASGQEIQSRSLVSCPYFFFQRCVLRDELYGGCFAMRYTPLFSFSYIRRFRTPYILRHQYNARPCEFSVKAHCILPEIRLVFPGTVA